MLDPNELISSEVALTFKRYALQQVVNAELNLEVDASIREHIWGDMVYQLKAAVLADELPPETFTARDRVTYEVPASTWQMWKKRHARRWYARRLVARWPVRYEPDPDHRGAHAVCTFNLERWRAYPQSKVYLPRDRFGDAVLGHSIRDLRWTEEPT
ncbi:hypothetical protein O3Q52_17515 [Streptomyces sp. ActVer]|uniref:hypothetical protein n=1 Tax=Streptomyces sp. ActVer TaxID=3014558 RepID=UPI0022B3FAFD|nr:hypothetical protein [Streptomyces sp. ActVer]MCZ4509964.1 hypothetical protein [Streptomyces sp. ActVer]